MGILAICLPFEGGAEGKHAATSSGVSSLTRGFCAQLLANAQAAAADKNRKRATVKPIKPEPKEKVKEKNSLRRRAAAEGSSRKTYTATLTARKRAACGLNIKLPKEKIEDIDAGDVYNELVVVEYAEDIYKFYKEAESTKVHSYNRNGLCALGFMDDPYLVRSAFLLLNQDLAKADKLLKIQRELDETKCFLGWRVVFLTAHELFDLFHTGLLVGFFQSFFS
nr:G2/mitotic-specific cyclin S13-7-like isoform X1 [Ipomoea batatas]